MADEEQHGSEDFSSFVTSHIFLSSVLPRHQKRHGLTSWHLIVPDKVPFLSFLGGLGVGRRSIPCSAQGAPGSLLRIAANGAQEATQGYQWVCSVLWSCSPPRVFHFLPMLVYGSHTLASLVETVNGERGLGGFSSRRKGREARAVEKTVRKGVSR